MPHDNIFSRFASTVTRWTGSTWAFIAALAIIAAWGLIGPLFYYSDTWQIVINTGTTIVTFVMVSSFSARRIRNRSRCS
jgi:low affinity Fe/Cu permease